MQQEDERNERISRFVINYRVTLGTAVHCIACRERLTFYNARYNHGNFLSGFHGCLKSNKSNERKEKTA